MAFSAHAQDRTQARSMVITRYGIVATEQTLASQIGAAILSQGRRWPAGMNSLASGSSAAATSVLPFSKVAGDAEQ